MEGDVMPSMIVIAVFTVGALLTSAQGHRTVAVLLMLIGVLIAAYTARHRARDRHIYRRYRAESGRD